MYASTNQSVATELFAVVPSDVTPFAKRARRLYVGTGGTVRVIDGKGNLVDFLNVPSGYTIDAEILRVSASVTTASNMIGFV